MKRVILEPLKDDYKIVVQRVTTLEKFHVCPYAFQFWGWYKPATPDKQVESERWLFLWNKVHELLQSYAINPDYASKSINIILDQMWLVYDEKEVTHFASMINAGMESYNLYRDEWIYNVISTEFHLYIEVECWDILLILTGSADALSQDDKGFYSILDWKTSKTEYDIDEFTGKIQKYSYPRMAANTVWRDKFKDFSYLVVTKHVTPRKERCPIRLADNEEKYTKATTKYDWLIQGKQKDYDLKVTSKEVDAFMKDLISNYCDSIRTNVWKAKNKTLIDWEETSTKQCIWCSLKSNCPAFKTTFSWLEDIF